MCNLREHNSRDSFAGDCNEVPVASQPSLRLHICIGVRSGIVQCQSSFWEHLCLAWVENSLHTSSCLCLLFSEAFVQCRGVASFKSPGCVENESWLSRPIMAFVAVSFRLHLHPSFVVGCNSVLRCRAPSIATVYGKELGKDSTVNLVSPQHCPD